MLFWKQLEEYATSGQQAGLADAVQWMAVTVCRRTDPSGSTHLEGPGLPGLHPLPRNPSPEMPTPGPAMWPAGLPSGFPRVRSEGDPGHWSLTPLSAFPGCWSRLLGRRCPPAQLSKASQSALTPLRFAALLHPPGFLLLQQPARHFPVKNAGLVNPGTHRIP